DQVSPPAVFGWIASAGGVSEIEMLRTFNCGVGMVVVADKDGAEDVLKALQEAGEEASIIGRLIARDGSDPVQYKGSLNL
ncbi:MAG: AIR synthase-related protein, partial [Pseudomonadota bacterium]